MEIIIGKHMKKIRKAMGLTQGFRKLRQGQNSQLVMLICQVQ